MIKKEKKGKRDKMTKHMRVITKREFNNDLMNKYIEQL